MHVRALRVNNFRHYEGALFEFGPGVTLICGPNARGKTSILEAIYLLMAGRSFRSQRLNHLIKYEKRAFFVEIHFQKHGVDQTLCMAYAANARKIFYNQRQCHSMQELIGLIPGTIILSEDILMIKGPPKLRRRFFDLLLSQLDPLYVYYLTRYQKALQQRNASLRRRQVRELEIFEYELAKSASYIVKKRREVLVAIESHGKKILSVLSESCEFLSLVYRSQVTDHVENLEGFYSEMYRKMRPREMQLGNTLVGPHQDDMQILLNGREAKYFASEGQKQSLACVLRFAEWECLQKAQDLFPLLMIDDFGVSFDKRRQQMLLKYMQSMKQVIITSTEKGGLSSAATTLIDLH